MEKTAFQKWVDGRMLEATPYAASEIAWAGALDEVHKEICRQHGDNNPVVKSVLRIIEQQAK